MKHRNFSVLSKLGIGGLIAAVGITTIANIPNLNSNPPLAMQVASAQTNSPLAQQLQGKPTVVKIYAEWCAACQKMKPIMASLQQQYGNNVNFVIFDVSDRASTQTSQAKAQQLGLSNFFDAHKSQTATVAIIDSSNGNALEEFRKNLNQQDYENAIDMAIAQVNR
jgi:thiol-disulfide isomerase/thioredoxin